MNKLIEVYHVIINSKFKYAIIAAIFALILFMIWGGVDAPAGFGNG